MRTIWALAIGALTLGCGDKDGGDTAGAAPSGDDTSGGAGGDDTSGAGGDDTGAGGDDTGAAPDAALCGDYFGVNDAGTTWEYQLSEPLIGTSSVTVKSWDSATGELTLETNSNTESSGTRTLSLTTQSYRCDDVGVWLTMVDVFYELYFNGAPLSSGWSRISYESPPLLHPNGASVGDSWTSVGVGTIETSDAPATDFESTNGFEIVSEESVTVLAGTYDALRIENTGGEERVASWVARGVGLVKADDLELVTYTP